MKTLKSLLILSITAFFLSSCAFTPLQTRNLYKRASVNTYDIIVVPGVPFENNEWSRLMKARVYWAKHLMEQGIARNVMFSGSAVYTPYFEAKIMAQYAEAIGIPKQNIYIETEAEHSTENIFYSYKKAKFYGFETIALASDPFQTRSLKNFIKNKVDPKVGVIPIIFGDLKKMESEMINPVIDPSLAYHDSFISITEREKFGERLKGTRGKTLEENIYESGIEESLESNK